MDIVKKKNNSYEILDFFFIFIKNMLKNIVLSLISYFCSNIKGLKPNKFI